MQGINFYPEYFAPAVDKLAEFIEKIGAAHVKGMPVQIAQPVQNDPPERGEKAIGGNASLQEAIGLLEADDFSKARFMLETLRDSGYTSRTFNLDDLIQTAVYGEQQTEFLRLVQLDYEEIARLAKSKRTLDQAQAAWKVYVQNYGLDYDPNGYADKLAEPIPDNQWTEPAPSVAQASEVPHRRGIPRRWLLTGGLLLVLALVGFMIVRSKGDGSLRTFSGHTNYVISVAFSPDGKYVLTGSGDQTAKLWDMATGQSLRTFSGHTGWVESVAFSPDGKYVLTGSRDYTAQLWDMATGQSLHTFSGHTNAVFSVAFSPDGKYVLTGSYDKTAKLWDMATGQSLRTFSGHTDSVESIAFSLDGKYVLTGSADNTAKLWAVPDNGPFGFIVNFLRGQ